MQADFSLELGAQDDSLELPWSDLGGKLRYYDLKRQPELLLHVQEAFDNEELGQFLVSLNSSNSLLETSKCDTWTSYELNEEEKIYGVECKFVSYVDLVFACAEERYALEAHERFVRSLCNLLKRAPEIASAAEFIIRHGYFHSPQEPETQQGFGITFYLSGYGDSEAEARARWNIGMKVVENALLQLSAMRTRAASLSNLH
ncbi:MAG: hypothetical protein ACRD36_05050 [Candidatus Acidiferrum sp.]